MSYDTISIGQCGYCKHCDLIFFIIARCCHWVLFKNHGPLSSQNGCNVSEVKLVTILLLHWACTYRVLKLSLTLYTAKVIIVPHRVMWSCYTGRWWLDCYIWYSKPRRSPPRPFLAVPNVTAHPSMATVPITVLRYNGLLLCGFHVPIKGLSFC